MNWRSGSKVFETEEEAIRYAKDMTAYGAVVSWGKTTEEVTHKYIGPNGFTREV